MAANPVNDFDLGPLTWVKTEIDHSLNQARENLDKLAAHAADRAPVKYILTHLHQATGALAMVGLGAATRFNEELEKLISFLETEDAVRLPAAVAAAKKGISALSEIDFVTKNLAQLIQTISSATQTQANATNKVAQNMQDILEITRQTTRGTQQAAGSIRDLAAVAQELKSSVSGFKL